MTRRIALFPALLLAASSAAAGVSGRVISSDGQPIAGVQVDAYALETSSVRADRLAAGRGRTSLASARSAADGSFLLGSAAAVVQWQASAEGFAPAAGAAVNGDALTVVLAPAKSRKGLVTARGKPVPGAIVVWSTGANRDAASTEILLRTSGDGSYQVPDPDMWASAIAIGHPDFAWLDVTPSSESGKWPSAISHELGPGVTIAGTVIDAGSRRGVAGARLWVDGWPLGVSAQAGAFLIAHAPPAWKLLLAKSPGLVGTAKPASGKLAVEARPARSLSGLVRDARTGEPLADAVVTAFGETASDAALSDASGRYLIDALPADRRAVFAFRAGYQLPEPDAHGEPSTADLRKSASLRKDFNLRRLPRIAGRVEDEQGKPLGNVRVGIGAKGTPNIYDADFFGGEGATTRSAPDGSFSLTAPAEGPLQGSIDQPLLALKEGYAAGRLDTPRIPGPADPPLRITLVRGVLLGGQVRSRNGLPLSEVAVSLAEDGFVYAREIPVHLELARNEAGWTKTDAEGRFAVHVHPTLHHLGFRKPGQVTKVMRAVDASSGQPLEVTLEPAAQIRGHVLHSDGSGAPGFSVVARDAFESASTPALSQEDGGFLVDELEPGLYQLTVQQGEQGILHSTTVEAPAADVRIQLGETGSIRGHVIDAATRAPVPRFMAALDDSEASEQLRAGPFSGVDGVLAIDLAPAGEVALTVRAEGYRARRLSGIAVPAGGSTPDLEIALEAGATVQGRVTTSRGEGLSDVRISAEDGDSEVSAESGPDGEYQLEGLAPGSLKLEYRLRGFVTVRKTVRLGASTRVDVTLLRGLSLAGTVMADGAPVPKANVTASSNTVDAEFQAAASDDGGRFVLAGLVPGRYTVAASSADQGEAKLEDVDPEKSGPLRLVLERPPTAILSGRVIGLPAGDDFMMGWVSASGENGRSDRAPLGTTGSFRLEKAPAGQVRVQADVLARSGATRSSKSVELMLAAGSENQTVIEFPSGADIAGTVTWRGVPVVGAAVSFRGTADGDAGAAARTDGVGHYQVTGLEPGPYGVSVAGDGVMFATQYLVSGSAEFDIDVTAAELRGLVRDASDGTPIEGVEVTLWLMGRENTPAGMANSNRSGRFEVASLAEGHYRLLTSKQGYGQEVRELDLARGPNSDLLLELSAADGVGIKVVDARDGRALDAIVVVRDLARHIVANRRSGEPDGSYNIALAAGPYILSTSATGYGTATLPITAPARGLRVGLTPGGTLVVESPRELRGRIRLIQPDGEEYVRCWCNGIADIDLTGRKTTVPNITPGNYTVELTVDGIGTASRPVSILEGQVSTVVVE